MARAQIIKDIWYRYIHDTWETVSGYRTDIAQSVLENSDVRRAAFILDDKRCIIVQMDDIRRILSGARKRSNGMVGPFNVNPHTETVDGHQVSMQIKILGEKKVEPTDRANE